MDLTKELLAVLDDPSDVWTSVVTNLTDDARLTLMVFTTHLTPVSLIEWQASVAKIDPAAATVFEKSLKTLDDTFVSVERDDDGNFYATFRNPSMDDFCAEHLNKHAGFISTVLSSKPSPGQLLRLTQLGTATSGLARRFQLQYVDGKPRLYKYLFGSTYSGSGQRRYRNIHQFLTEEQIRGITLDAIIDAYHVSPRFQKMLILSMFVLIGSTKDFDTNASARHRLRLQDVIEAMSKWQSHTDTILDDRVAARGLRRFLGSDFRSFYTTLCAEADMLNEFDSLANFESALGMDGLNADWGDRFEAAARATLEEVDETDDAISAQQCYENVASHLGLDDRAALDAWEERVKELRNNEESPDDDDDDDPWERERPDRGAADEEAMIDGMFDGLVERRL